MGYGHGVGGYTTWVFAARSAHPNPSTDVLPDYRPVAGVMTRRQPSARYIDPSAGPDPDGSLSWEHLDRLTAKRHEAATHRADQLAEVVQFWFEPNVGGPTR